MHPASITLAVSACLLGEKVRYDGDDKFHPELNQWLQQHAITVIPVCPETAIGLGIPRPPIQVTRQGSRQVVVGREDTSLDVTQALHHFASEFLRRYPQVRGFILKARSPSCGYQNTPLFLPNTEIPIGVTSGGFVQGLLAEQPKIPIADETIVVDPAALRAFLHQIEASGGLS